MGLTIGLLMVLILQLGSYKVNDMRGKDRERGREGGKHCLLEHIPLVLPYSVH